ncbi:hypothetical protein [Brachybacterium huguangmaarense]
MSIHDSRPDALFPQASAPRTLRAHDPAELAAQVELLMGEPLAGALAVLGHRAGVLVLSARLPLGTDRMPAPGPAALDDLLAALAVEGCSGAFAVLAPVTGGGSPATQAVGEAVSAAAALIEASRAPRRPRIDEAWVLAGAIALPVRRGGRSGAHVGAPVPLAWTGSTLVAAQAVAAGTALPRPADIPAVRAHLLSARLGVTATPVTAPAIAPGVADAWEGVLAALAHCRDHPAPDGDEACVTACEHLGAFLRGLDAVPRADAFAAVFLGRGQEGPRLAAPDLLERADAEPHDDVRPGGSWYEALRALEAAARPSPPLAPVPGRPEVPAGWPEAASVLALAAWWNLRFATSSALAEEVLRHRPGHRLARWAAVLADGWAPARWNPARRQDGGGGGHP